MESEDKDRIANLGELATVLAHEMKNPMNSIIINLEVLRSTVSELAPDAQSVAAQKAKKYLDVIEGEVRRLDKVLRSFLDFASPPQATKVRFKINPVIKMIMDFMAVELKHKNVDIDLQLTADLPPLLGSADQFKQVLLNLIINALQAMPAQGGRIRLATELTTDADASFLLVTVSDNGKGIDPEVMNRIFDPYFTTKTRGSGLGLTVVKRFARDHGGHVSVKSMPDQGTTFSLKLPIQRVEPQK
jgi:signal transduction histidine kinase